MSKLRTLWLIWLCDGGGWICVIAVSTAESFSSILVGAVVMSRLALLNRGWKIPYLLDLSLLCFASCITSAA